MIPRLPAVAKWFKSFELFKPFRNLAYSQAYLFPRCRRGFTALVQSPAARKSGRKLDYV
jgi:hypothetical protein